MLRYQPTVKSFDTLAQLPDPILDGSVDNRNLYLLTANGCYVLSSDMSVKKLISLSKAHTVELISGTEMVIATDNGLFLLNTASNALESLIVGIEFNRRALFIKDEVLHAGSINGLYSIQIKDFPLLIRKNSSAINRSTVPWYLILGLLLVFGIISSLSYFFIRERKKVLLAAAQIKEFNAEPLTKEIIEKYIRENLSTASLKSITEHFNTNVSHIYKLIEPEKPGTIIQKMRIEKLIQLRAEGKDINEIAAATGLSVSYLKKIKNKIEG